MKRIALLALLAVGCAHAPVVESARTETAVAGDSVRVIRGALVDAMLGATRVTGSILNARLVGSPSYLGTIDFTGTAKTNAEATTPFADSTPTLCARVMLMQPTQAVYILPVTTSTGDVTAANGVELQSKERVIIMFPDGTTTCFLSALRVTSNGDLKMWELK